MYAHPQMRTYAKVTSPSQRRRRKWTQKRTRIISTLFQKIDRKDTYSSEKLRLLFQTDFTASRTNSWSWSSLSLILQEPGKLLASANSTPVWHLCIVSTRERVCEERWRYKLTVVSRSPGHKTTKGFRLAWHLRTETLEITVRLREFLRVPQRTKYKLPRSSK